MRASSHGEDEPLGLVLGVAVFIGLAVIAAFIGLGRIIEGKDSVKDRLDALTPLPAIEDAPAATEQQDKELHPLAGRLNRVISRQAFAASIATELARANLPLTVPEYILLNIASVCVLSLLVLALSRQLVLAVIGGVAGFALPGLYVRRKQSQRMVAFQDQLVDSLTLLMGSLRSGYGMTIAMDTVAKQMPPPTSEEFGRVVREIGLGVSTTQALANLVRRIRSDDLDLVVTAITIQHEIGGNLANILETITNTIRERIRLKGQLRALTAQQSLQRYVLTALPFALGGIIYVMNPRYMKTLFTPGFTLIIPIGAVVSITIGYVIMGKLSNIEV